MQDELDKDLQSLFREQSRNLPEEPFLSDTLRLVKKRRARRILEQNLILLLAVIVCALSSRLIIKGSILLSGYLDWIFKLAELFMDRPAGILIIALCSAISLLIFRRRIISAFV
jgi:hypothetical protein